MKETEKFRGSNKKKVTTLQAEINELKESISDNFVDVNSDNKTNSNIKQVNNNNNSQKATDRDYKYNEKVKEIKTLKTQLVKLKMH